MKVALCFSGEARNFRSAIHSQHLHIIKKYNCDIFMHTWMYDGLYTKNSRNCPWSPNFDINEFNEHHTDEHLIGKELFALYNPKKIKIDYPDRHFFMSLAPADKQNLYGVFMMYYSIYHANELKKQYEAERGFVYDMVIRCRFALAFSQCDLITDNPSNKIYLPPNENTNVSFTPEMKERLRVQGPSFMPNDQFANGTSVAIDYYSRLFLDLLDNKYTRIHPEGLIENHLWDLNHTAFKPEINNNILMQVYR